MLRYNGPLRRSNNNGEFEAQDEERLTQELDKLSKLYEDLDGDSVSSRNLSAQNLSMGSSGMDESQSSHAGDDVSSMYATSHAGTVLTTTSKSEQELSRRETFRVMRFAFLFIVLLLVAAFVLSGIIFKSTVERETEAFDESWDHAADQMLEAFQDIVPRLSSVAGLAVAFTSQGQRQATLLNPEDATSVVASTTWPFVTLQDFTPQARNALQQSGSNFLGMSPLVTSSQVDDWNAYVQQPQNQAWIRESLRYQHHLRGGANTNATTEAWLATEPSQTIHMDPLAPTQHAWYLPTWQISPYVEGMVNTNLLTPNTSAMLAQVADTGTASLGPFQSQLPTTMESTSIMNDMVVSPIYLPIFQGFHATQRQVVGLLTALLPWQHYFANVLSDTTPPVLAVLEYRCDDNVDTEKQAERRHLANDDAQQREAVELVIFDFQTAAPTTTPPPGSSNNNNYWHVPASTDADANEGGYWHIPADNDNGNNNDNNNDNNNEEPTGTSNPYWNMAATATTSPTTTTGNNGYWNMPANENNEAATSSSSALPEEPATTTNPPTTAATAQATTPPEETNPPTIPAGNNEQDTPASSTSQTPPASPEAQGESQYYSYVINGPNVELLGPGDWHDATYDEFVRVGKLVQDGAVLQDGTVQGIPIHTQCGYYVHVYPSKSFYDEYITTAPIVLTVVVGSVFLVAILMFLCYNRLVERRQRKILKKATQSTAIVSSLFPKNVRDRLMQGEALPPTSSAGGGSTGSGNNHNNYNIGTKSRLKGFVSGETNVADSSAAPIADLYPECTVFFADIAGFTAWSSTREPAQVFILLQNVYQAFDTIAKRRKVFKVETIGDCYMAVTGLPDPQPAHASIMVRFSYDCLTKMKEITKRLESSLGPDTTELSMRIGLNSGPVTAGVLQGERARFQLFGDTVNTASRMESTGMRGKIQVSETTANQLREAGKEHWLTPRVDAVQAKGKGSLRTFWANPKNSRGTNSSSQNSSSWDTNSEELDEDEERVDAKDVLHQAHIRLVDWIVQLMLDDIKKIVYARKTGQTNKTSKEPLYYMPPKGATCMDEVKQVIHMPAFDAGCKAHQSGEYKKVEIDPDIVKDLGLYVTALAAKYRNNPFHNFEHACHVTMSTNKLLRRIVAPELSKDQIDKMECSDEEKLAMHLHDYTYGINSDPLAMFAMTFSALIHDVDHQGISNMQLAIEDPEMKAKYHNKSIAEQNSLDLAWSILMRDSFANLRRYLFGTQEEMLRFRQLIVNIVLATDIFDKELNDLRKVRWQKAFSGEAGEDGVRDSDLRATIVIEHIIQASDVSHTMQHWHVYQKWNKCLFKEMYAAFKQGRLAKNPASFWYRGEMGFFDNYIIPLAKKLKECGVFGVSSDEYLNYAVNNRAEWEEKGEALVTKMIEEAEDMLREKEAQEKKVQVAASKK